MRAMPSSNILLPAVALTALIAAGCGGEPAAGPAAPAALAEADLVATWRMDQPAMGDTARITMAVSADRTLLLSVHATVAAGDGSKVRAEVRRERMTWTFSGNTWVSTKPDCEYMDVATGRLEAGECIVPVQEAAQVAVNGRTLTVVKGELIYYFTRD